MVLTAPHTPPTIIRMIRPQRPASFYICLISPAIILQNLGNNLQKEYWRIETEEHRIKRKHVVDLFAIESLSEEIFY